MEARGPQQHPPISLRAADSQHGSALVRQVQIYALHHHGSVRLNGHNYELAERQGAENMANAALQAQAGRDTIGVRPHLDGGFDPPP